MPVDAIAARDLAVWAIVSTVPIAVVVIVALLRGYTISLHLTRDGRTRRGDQD